MLVLWSAGDPSWVYPVFHPMTELLLHFTLFWVGFFGLFNFLWNRKLGAYFTHSWWPLRKGGAVEAHAEDAVCIWGWGSSCTSAPLFLGSHYFPEKTQWCKKNHLKDTHLLMNLNLLCLCERLTLMSLMSCRVGVSIGVLLSMTPCIAAVHLMASFSILV